MATDRRKTRDEETDERLLLERVAASDRDAFATLFECYYPRLFKFIFRLTRTYTSTEELVNDVMLTVWQTAANFRGESKVSTWIFGIAYRQALRRLRRRRLSFLPIEEAPVPVENTGDSIENEDWLQDGIRRLSPKLRLTVLLVYYVGLSCEETAQATGSPVNTVKTRMFHARRKLGEILVPEAHDKAQSEKANDD